jgi:selenocysteine-specific elongation factor
MHILGTAGHVDHGKSSLISALTGTNPDRLKEEITRQMTIDLGFAALNLPNGETIGIIDVPGHRDFISNMLAGIGGIDAALLVIATDEGVSAQTREHLAILDLLDVRHGVVVLTKIDLVIDPGWLELVELEAHELLEGTSLANAPCVAVSAQTGEGLEKLLETLEAVLKETKAKRNLGRPRLPVDRVFSMAGFGTVVTGTLVDGSLSLGEELVSLPEGQKGRIRGLQNHHHKVQKIDPGFRTAVNLSGIEHGQIQRGDVLCHPGDYQPSTLLDVSFRLLSDAGLDLKHNQEMKLYIGAAERVVRGRLLGTEKVQAGQEAFLQLRLDRAVVAERGDRFILRQPSPSQTLGGGLVLDAHPSGMPKRFDKKYLLRLEQLREGNDAQLILQQLDLRGFCKRNELARHAGLSAAAADDLIDELLKSGDLLAIQERNDPGSQYLGSLSYYQKRKGQVQELLAGFHSENSLLPGHSRESLRSQLGASREQFDVLMRKLEQDNIIQQSGTLIALANHRVKLTEQEMSLARPILEAFSLNPFSPPDRKAIISELGETLTEGLAAAEILVKVSEDIFFLPETVSEMQSWVIQQIQATGSMSLAIFRDHFKTSRKYAAAFLEYLDKIGITVRKGDHRLLRIVQS